MKKNVFLIVGLVVLLVGIYVLAYNTYYDSLHKTPIRSFFIRDDKKVTEVSEEKPQSPSALNALFDTILPTGKVSEKIPEPPREDKPIRGIYISASAMNSPKVRERIVKILDTTRINALVIDVKDSTGAVFLPIVEEPYLFSQTPYTENAQQFIKDMKARGVYLIARITVFQDPLMSKHFPEYALKDKTGVVWRDRKGMAFLDPQNSLVWDHTIHLATATRDFGFDEINFDYIRYPSDGKISDIAYHIPEGSTKSDMIEKFFMHLHDELRVKRGIYMSADIFGDTVRLLGDPGIGQVFEKTLPHFDAVAPMVYPSHFSPGSYGYLEPDNHPVEVMQGIARDTNRRFDEWCDTLTPVIPLGNESSISQKEADRLIKESEEKRKEHCSPWKNRPWVQDFSLHADYGVTEVKGQIDALESAGITSWLVWNPSSRYTIDAFK